MNKQYCNIILLVHTFFVSRYELHRFSIDTITIALTLYYYSNFYLILPVEL